MMKEQLILFKTAILAKEKGFEIETSSYYTPDGELHLNFKESYGEAEFWFDPEDFEENWNAIGLTVNRVEVCSASSQSLLQRWLRENYKVYIEVCHYALGFIAHLTDAEDNDSQYPMREPYFETYEEALEVGLIEGLKLIL